MWFKCELKKRKKNQIFKLAYKFIDIGEDITRYMKEEGRTQEDIIQACVDLEVLENNILGEEL